MTSDQPGARRRALAASPLGGLLGLLLRARLVVRHLSEELCVSFRWVRTSRETTNFNYDVTPLNRLHLAWWVAEATSVSVTDVLEYFEELESDEALDQHIRTLTARSRYRRISDEDVRYGRRLAWYALVRVLRPSHVVETGIDKGLGTCVIAAALIRNGHGRVTAIDVVPDAGWLVAGTYATHVDLVVGDAAEAIASVTTPVDLHIHDVHFTAEQEQAEYEAICRRLGSRPFILNDNAHSHAVLAELAASRGWHFSAFREVPAAHWYRGGELALAWPR